MKKILSGITTLLFGIYTSYLLLFFIISFFAVPMYFNLSSFRDLYKEQWLNIILIGLFLILLYVCVRFIFKAKKDHNELYNVFKPNWKKFFLTFILLIILMIITTLSNEGNFAVFKLSTFTPVSLANNIWLLLLSIIVNFLTLYPFGSALYSLLANKKKQKSKHPIKLYVLLMLLFNPLSFQIGASGLGGFIYAQKIYNNTFSKCGAQIVEVDKGSPAEKAGLTRLDVINSVNDLQIKT